MDIKDKLIKEFENKPTAELPEAPVYALQGVSVKDADLLKKSFNILTIRELAMLKYAAWAREIAAAAQSGTVVMPDYQERLDKKYERFTPEKLLKSPVHALQGLSKADSERLYKAFKIKTIAGLAGLKYIDWAIEIVNLARPADETKILQSGQKHHRSGPLLFIGLVAFAIIIAFIFAPVCNEYLNDYEMEKTLRGDTKKTGIQVKTKDNSAVEKQEIQSNDKNIYVVKPYDTLKKISREMLGSESDGKKIHDLNHDSVKDPDNIKPGLKLRLP